jgi:oligopeptide transport system permease protein
MSTANQTIKHQKERESADLFEIDKGRSPLRDAWREFHANKLGMAGAVFIVLIVLVAIFARYLTPYDYATQNNRNSRAEPMTGYVITTDYAQEKCHWYDTPLEWGCTIFFTGSDGLGRDLWSRAIYGTRISLSVAFVAASVSLIIGTTIGTISGFVGGYVDDFIMRLVDFLYAVPILPIIILMQVYFQALTRQGVRTGLAGVLIRWNQSMGGLLFIFIAMGALGWLGMARLARGQVLANKQKEYVEAARSIGANSARITFRHLLPNIIAPLLIAETLAIPGYIFTEAALSFIGLGVNPPTPSWGAMINEGRLGLRSSPHLVLVPGIMLALLTLAFNFMGDGLRDALDPRVRRS